MKITELIPMMRVSDVEKTVIFYKEVLGFICNAFSEDWSWASITKGDNISLMITGFLETEAGSNSIFTGSFYFRIDTDIDLIWNDLKDKMKICYSIENFDYGMREFAVYDINGYLLQFGQEIVK